MAVLRSEVKAFIVQALACFDTPSQVVTAVKTEFGIEISRQQCESHDPTKYAGQGLGAKWVELFHAARKRFREETADIPIANRAFRLRTLGRMAESREHEEHGADCPTTEQAAKEVGDVFVNRRLEPIKPPGSEAGAEPAAEYVLRPDEDVPTSPYSDGLVALTPKQANIYCWGFQPEARFRDAVCGRRFGKTFLGKAEMRRAAKLAAAWNVSVEDEIWYAAPTQKQARRVFWRRLKQAIEILAGDQAERNGHVDHAEERSLAPVCRSGELRRSAWFGSVLHPCGRMGRLQICGMGRSHPADAFHLHLHTAER